MQGSSITVLLQRGAASLEHGAHTVVSKHRLNDNGALHKAAGPSCATGSCTLLTLIKCYRFKSSCVRGQCRVQAHQHLGVMLNKLGRVSSCTL